MADGVTTRLQKEVSQLQRDLEKLEVQLNVKLDKMNEKFHLDLQVGLQQMNEKYEQGMANITVEIGNVIRQCLP